ncbi:response regulator transcription factor [Maribellus sediminis]|uniref:response regulator transcription factor n=1 Tax=Maribellus sediminis TaxID=2696285 RepID=UPI001431397C|nr:response regulator transcription factor [Maribellus sediminis]
MDKAKLNIVVTDDHKLFRKGICALLYDFDFTNDVKEAGNGQELLDLIDSSGEVPNLVLLDIQMPVMDGVEATERLKAKYPDLRIIIISMEEDVQLVTHLVDKGIDGYLLKNADPEELELAIRMTMKNEFYFSSSLTGAFMRGSKTVSPVKDVNNADLFSERELQVLELICKELTASEIADELSLSARTVEGYKRGLLSKSNTRNVAGLVIYAIKNQLVEV